MPGILYLLPTSPYIDPPLPLVTAGVSLHPWVCFFLLQSLVCCIFLDFTYKWYWASHVALVVKNPSANARDTRDVGSIPGSGRCLFLFYQTLEESHSPIWRLKVLGSHTNRNQLWIFIVRTTAEAEAPILWPPDAQRRLTGKDSDDGRDWRQRENGATDDEMVRQHHWPDGHEFEQTPGDSRGQRSLACYSPRGHKDSDTT